MDFTVNEILNAYTFLFFLIRFGGSRVCVGQFHRFFTIFLFNIVFPVRSRKPFGGKKKIEKPLSPIRYDLLSESGAQYAQRRKRSDFISSTHTPI